MTCLVGLAGVLLAKADTIFSENMGSPTGTTAIASNAFQNSGTLTFSGTGDVRISTSSTGYAGASGSGNVFLTNNGTAYFQISGINTTGYAAGSLDLSFGAFKSTTASNMSELSLQYSTDGSTWLSLSIPAQATGSGTANWRLISFADTALPISSSLFLKWTNTGTGPQFRLDDVILSGSLTAVPEPREYAIAFVGLLGVIVLTRRRSMN